MVYGNPNAKSESNGNAVFEMFDVQGIVGFWHMDEPQWTGATGEVRDETGVNHGTAYGGATTTSDAKYGRAGYFDGEDDYVEVPDSDSLDITDEITIEAWVKYTPFSSGEKYFLAKWDYGANKRQYAFGLRNTGDSVLARFYLSNDGTYHSDYVLEGTTNLNSNQWYYLVATYDGATQKICVNGEQEPNTKSFSISIFSSDSNLTVGSLLYNGDPDMLFYGLIDEVRIYNRALSPTEIQILSKNYMQKMGSYFNVRKYVTPAPVVIV